ncbi:hypothetical protein [Spiroplasma endosymbiont of Cleonymus obscurus]|uniref:hypothetical protein n=1 Tax=Spiroplasma endosymbiont of Cleonymus obscurus TaxID=3066324 RepID=UPI0037DD5A90
MKICSYKYELYNINRNYQSNIKSRSFICSNCFNKQLIKDNFIFIGYCNKNSAINSHSLCGDLTDNDELTFVCSYKNCLKISLNNLNGNPKYNVVQLNKKDLERFRNFIKWK